MRFKNISPAGALDLPLLGRVVEAGEEFDIPTDRGQLLELQPDIFEWVDRPAGEPTVKELQAQLREAGLPVSGTKPELLARLTVAKDPEGTSE